MGKGTLQDILSDEKITLDDMFKSSMIGDAAKVVYLNTSHILEFAPSRLPPHKFTQIRFKFNHDHHTSPRH